MSQRRRLTLDDVARLADLAAAAHAPHELYAAVDRLVQEVIGHKLFTLMRVHEASAEVERIYSSNTAAYPVGGRKAAVDRAAAGYPQDAAAGRLIAAFVAPSLLAD